MNILLTGSTGFVGKHLKKRLLEQGHRVFCLTRKKRDYGDFEMDLIQPIEGEILLDLYKKDINVLIHLASRMIEPEMSAEEEREVFYTNMKITENILRIMKVACIKKIINFSSIAVYPNKTGFYSETSEINMSGNCECMYGLSKFCAEMMFTYYLRECVVTNLRVAQVYGEGMRSDRIISLLRRNIILYNMMEIWGNGERTSNFISIDKLLEILDIFIEGNHAGIYNVGEENLSYLEVAERLKKKYGDESTRIILKCKGIKSRVSITTKKMKDLEERYNVKRRNE